MSRTQKIALMMIWAGILGAVALVLGSWQVRREWLTPEGYLTVRRNFLTGEQDVRVDGRWLPLPSYQKSLKPAPPRLEPEQAGEAPPPSERDIPTLPYLGPPRPQAARAPDRSRPHTVAAPAPQAPTDTAQGVAPAQPETPEDQAAAPPEDTDRPVLVPPGDSGIPVVQAPSPDGLQSAEAPPALSGDQVASTDGNVTEQAQGPSSQPAT